MTQQDPHEWVYVSSDPARFSDISWCTEQYIFTHEIKLLNI